MNTSLIAPRRSNSRLSIALGTAAAVVFAEGSSFNPGSGGKAEATCSSNEQFNSLGNTITQPSGSTFAVECIPTDSDPNHHRNLPQVGVTRYATAAKTLLRATQQSVAFRLIRHASSFHLEEHENLPPVFWASSEMQQFFTAKLIFATASQDWLDLRSVPTPPLLPASAIKTPCVVFRPTTAPTSPPTPTFQPTPPPTMLEPPTEATVTIPNVQQPTKTRSLVVRRSSRSMSIVRDVT